VTSIEALWRTDPISRFSNWVLKRSGYKFYFHCAQSLNSQTKSVFFFDRSRRSDGTQTVFLDVLNINVDGLTPVTGLIRRKDGLVGVLLFIIVSAFTGN